MLWAVSNKNYYIVVNAVTAFVSALGGTLGFLFSLWMFWEYKELFPKLIFISLLLFGAFCVCFINIKVEKRNHKGR